MKKVSKIENSNIKNKTSNNIKDLQTSKNQPDNNEDKRKSARNEHINHFTSREGHGEKK